MVDFKEMKNDSEMERFGPLRVLLVESDDSTRNIIAALLRKCSYQVSTESDGLRAWETLKGGPKGIDLILTEVELPSISGYALLTLIMEHDICKNIPVIMMSPKDSISISLKCMSRGAADFLIKPVRKNELRNLWQHVWRRQTGQHQMIIESECRLSNTRRQQESTQKITASREHPEVELKGAEVESENHTTNVYIHEKNCEDSDSPNEATDLIGKFASPDTYRNVSANDTAESPFTKLELSLRRSNTSGLEDSTSEDIVSLNHSKDSAFSRYENSKLRKNSPILELSDTCLGFTTSPIVKLANSDNSYTRKSYPQSDLSSDWILKSQHEQSSKPNNSSIVHDTPSKEDCSMDFNKDNKLQSLDKKLNLKRCGSISSASEVNNTEASGDFSKATLSESINDNNVLASDGSRETSSHHNTQREAALYKFRLKRKDRCFEKKVRYQSRKKLAEQRPRVKGQFVRQDAM